MIEQFRKIFTRKGKSNLKAIIVKLLNGEALSEEEKVEAMKYVDGESETKVPGESESEKYSSAILYNEGA